MNKYQNGKIYKLVNTEGTLIYIGSTCQSLSKRKENHHSDYKRWKNGKCCFVTSFKIFDDDEDGCKIVLLEAFPCDSKIELEKRERFYIESINCINKVRPTRSHKEYYEDNKDKIKQQIKQYQIDNNDKIQQYKNEKHKCVCCANYTTKHKSRHIKTIKHINYIESIKTQENELKKLEEEFENISSFNLEKQ